MDHQVIEFLALTVPVLIVFYMAFLLFIRPPRPVFLASLLGGILIGLVNLLVDLLAYYMHWWHYAPGEVILHVPLPYYISLVLAFGSVAYMLIWRLWYGHVRWLSYVLLAGVPLFCIVRDIVGYRNPPMTLDNAVVAPFVVAGMWLVAFFVGFWVFWRLASLYRPVVVDDGGDARSSHG